MVALSNDHFVEIDINSSHFRRKHTTSDTWLPEKRARYNSKRRKKDIELIFSIWNEALPSHSSQVVNIAHVPANITKKYKRALKAHGNDLRRIDEEWTKEWNPYFEDDRMVLLDGSCVTPSCDKMVPHAMKMLRLLKERFPTHKTKVIVDLPFNFRDRYGELTIMLPCFQIILYFT